MKKLLVAVAAALAALAVAAPASAHNATAVIDCVDQTLSVTYTYSEFPEGSSTVSHETVTANGNVVYEDLDYSFQGDNEHTITVPFTGDAHVVASWDFTSTPPFHGVGSVEKDVSCGTPPPTTTTTGGETTGGGTTGGGGVIGSTTGGTTGGSAEAGGELPFTGLPVWIPVLLAFALIVSGGFLLRRKRDDVS